jgi:hypothetical protein
MRFACSTIALVLILASPVRAESFTFNELKAKIFDARMALKTFVGGLRFCKELDGTNFYYQPRNRVLNLEEYHQSLDNLVKAQVFNPEKRRPWNAEDANQRWEQVKKQAIEEKETCKLVALLPELEKRLEELQPKPEEPKEPKKAD